MTAARDDYFVFARSEVSTKPCFQKKELTMDIVLDAVFSNSVARSATTGKTTSSANETSEKNNLVYHGVGVHVLVDGFIF